MEIEREADGRWPAEVPELSGVMTYGKTRDEAIARWGAAPARHTLLRERAYLVRPRTSLKKEYDTSTGTIRFQAATAFPPARAALPGFARTTCCAAPRA